MKKAVKNPALQTWSGLNAALRTATESRCHELLKEELRGRRRRQFLKRIHSRLNRVRAIRERRELLS